jgi:hypothetical protein
MSGLLKNFPVCHGFRIIRQTIPKHSYQRYEKFHKFQDILYGTCLNFISQKQLNRITFIMALEVFY